MSFWIYPIVGLITGFCVATLIVVYASALLHTDAQWVTILHHHCIVRGYSLSQAIWCKP